MKNTRFEFYSVVTIYVMQLLTHFYTLEFSASKILNDLDDILIFFVIIVFLYYNLYQCKNWARILIILYNGVIILSMFNEFFLMKGVVGLIVAITNGSLTAIAILILNKRNVRESCKKPYKERTSD